MQNTINSRLQELNHLVGKLSPDQRRLFKQQYIYPICEAYAEIDTFNIELSYINALIGVALATAKCLTMGYNQVPTTIDLKHITDPLDSINTMLSNYLKK